MFTIPLMLDRRPRGLLLKGQNLSMFTLVGVVMLIGIVVNNGILLVDYTNLLRGRGMGLMEACIQGGASRFRPVVMTAGATILGDVPMAFFESGSSSMTQPIGLAVIGGLTSATFITLLLIPVVYYLINKRQAKKEGQAMKRIEMIANQSVRDELIEALEDGAARHRVHDRPYRPRQGHAQAQGRHAHLARDQLHARELPGRG